MIPPRGPAAMERRAAQRYGPNWRQRLGPRRSRVGYAAKPTVTLDVDNVMAGCRDWFLAHAAGEGWRGRYVVNYGIGQNTLEQAHKRLQRGDWDMCAVCNTPVYDDERQSGEIGLHPFCQLEPIQDRDSGAATAAA